MRIFHYNLSLKFYHLDEDYGTVSDPADETFDCGDLGKVVENDEEKYTVDQISRIDSNNLIAKVKGKSVNKFERSIFTPHENLNIDSIVFCGIILTWIGVGSAFELDNGSERVVAPYLTGGTVR
jgi:hypothetical protein